MSYNSILNFIDTADLSNESDVQKLMLLVTSRYREARFLSLCKLGNESQLNLSVILEKTLHDKDELVRTEAVEIVGERKLVQFLPNLIKLLSDPSAIVKAAAAAALGDIGTEQEIESIKKLLLPRQSGIVTVSAIYALAVLDKDNSLWWTEKLVGKFVSKNYRVRCRIINSMMHLTNDENVKTFLQFFRDALKGEETIAVKSTINRAIADLVASHKVI